MFWFHGCWPPAIVTRRCDTEDAAHDFDDHRLTRTPIEILMVLRLREWLSLRNPFLEHPPMDAPFHRLPIPQPSLAPDEVMHPAARAGGLAAF
jgi:hypothetical protein